MPEGLAVCIRGTIAFFMLLLMTRILGKRQISQLTFFDYAFGITVGSIAASITIDLTLKLIPAVMGILVWTFWITAISLGDILSRRWRRIFDGEPTVVIQNGKILEKNLELLNYTVDDLRMQLRNKGSFNMGHVEFAVVEPNGQLSLLKKTQYQTLTAADINMPTKYQGLAVELIMDGKIVSANLKQVGLAEEWLREEIAHRGYEVSDVFYAELETSGELYVDVKSDLNKIPMVQDIDDKEK
jgi:uncharacterized membrane protein YcaP (DUF421 family)